MYHYYECGIQYLQPFHLVKAGRQMQLGEHISPRNNRHINLRAISELEWFLCTLSMSQPVTYNATIECLSCAWLVVCPLSSVWCGPFGDAPDGLANSLLKSLFFFFFCVSEAQTTLIRFCIGEGLGYCGHAQMRPTRRVFVSEREEMKGCREWMNNVRSSLWWM